MNLRTLFSAPLRAALCLLFLTVPLWAQDDNPSAADKKPTPATETNPTAPKPLAEESDTVSNTSPAETTESSRGRYRGPLVVLWSDAELKVGDSAEAVVVLWGNAKVRGTVRDSVVTIGGSADIEGEVGQAVVSVLGDIKVSQGARVRREAVAVAGDVSVDGEVERDVVAVLGDVKAGPAAHLGGKSVAVGGRVDAAEGAVLDRRPFPVDFGRLNHGLRAWLAQCVFKLRPLAPQVGFVWMVAGFFFLLYLAIAVLLPRPVMACVGQLTTRPAATFFMGLLAKILVPVIILILAATGVGAIVVPFVLAALIFGAFIGKVALFESLGSSLGRRFGTGMLQAPLLAFLAGILLITLLYMVPVVGLITLALVSVWGLGGAITAALRGLRRELPKKSPAPLPGVATPLERSAAQAATGAEVGITGSVSEEAQAPQAASITPPATNLPEVLAYPRASFWERLGAGFLDLILVGILTGFLHAHPFGFLIALAYFAGLWTWKGTTVGGIVLGLKVVRLDGQPVNLLVALVRGLAAAFSVMVFFLGFLWIIWDADRQAWHDKIAGTVVLRLPRGTSLVCI